MKTMRRCLHLLRLLASQKISRKMRIGLKLEGGGGVGGEEGEGGGEEEGGGQQREGEEVREEEGAAEAELQQLRQTLYHPLRVCIHTHYCICRYCIFCSTYLTDISVRCISLKDKRTLEIRTSSDGSRAFRAENA